MSSPTPGESPAVPPGPLARPEVETLTAYSAPLEGRRGLLRLDFNENTVGPSPTVVEAIRSIPADHYAIYPEYDGLREAVVASLLAEAGRSPGPSPGAPALTPPTSACSTAWTRPSMPSSMPSARRAHAC